MMTDCYTMLGLRRDATRTEILAAFRMKSKDCHPDQGGNPEEFRRLLAAKNAALAALEYAEFFRETQKPKEEAPIGKITGAAEPPPTADPKPREEDQPVRGRNWRPLIVGVSAFGAGALAASLWAVVHFTDALELERPQGQAAQNSAQSENVDKLVISFK